MYSRNPLYLRNPIHIFIRLYYVFTKSTSLSYVSTNIYETKTENGDEKLRKYLKFMIHDGDGRLLRDEHCCMSPIVDQSSVATTS